MTCVIHHGPPGSFKSFGTIQRAVIPELQKGRTVVTNIRGLNSIERIEQAMDLQLPAEAQIVYVDADSEKGFNAMRVFHHWVPDGALIAMDETQRIYSKKRHRDLKSLDLKLTDRDGNRRPDEDIKAESPYWDGSYERPETVETAFDQHRHHNWDIYCTTPNISKIHPEIREVVEVAYRHKGKGMLLPWWRNKWLEFTHDAESSGKSVSHYMGSPKDFKADERIFACYQSTKTGKAVGSSETRPIYRDPKLQMVFGAIICLFTFFVYSAVHTYQTSPIINGLVNKDSQTDATAPGQDGSYTDRDGNTFTGDTARLAADFDALEPESDSQLTKVATTDNSVIEGVSGFLGAYSSNGFDIRLSAVLTRANGSAIFRIHVFDEDEMIDSITQDELALMGYRFTYSSSGLTVSSSQESFLIRPFGALKLPAAQTPPGRRYASPQGVQQQAKL